MLISSINFKGGQGKSLWAAILAHWLGPTAEILDLDYNQGDAYAWAGKANRPARLVKPTDLVVTLHDAAQAEQWFVADCPPHEGKETRYALELSAMVLVPVVPGGPHDFRGWGRMRSAIRDAKVLNPGLKAATVLNASRRTSISREFYDQLTAWHAPKEGRAVLGIVPLRVAMAEALGVGDVPTDESVTAVLAKLRRFAAL
jgi:cellulose biosynthesis protein BcsQ